MADFSEKMTMNHDIIKNLSDRIASEAQGIYSKVEKAKMRNINFEHSEKQLPEIEKNSSIKAVPINGATPDLSSAEPFWRERQGDFAIMAFRDIEPYAVRNGGRAILTYPFVLVAIDIQTVEPVYIVAAEIGSIGGTSFLCGFDGEGRHLNFGAWDSGMTEDDFIQRAKPILTRALNLSTPEK